MFIFVKNTTSLLPYKPIGEPWTELGEVDSSNNYAMRQVQSHLAEHGATYFADYQNKGKGQRGKNWNAEPGKNIIMSVVLQPHFLTIDNKFVVSACVALACHDFFIKYAVDNTYIKWPNDLYWKDRKAGGILVENILQGQNWKYTIAGIGININQTLFSPELVNPVSLKQITGKNYDPLLMGKKLCSCLQLRWEMLMKNDHDLLIKDYNDCLYKSGEKVAFKKQQAIFTATIRGVNKYGELLADTGTITAIPLGDEIEWLHS